MQHWYHCIEMCATSWTYSLQKLLQCPAHSRCSINTWRIEDPFGVPLRILLPQLRLRNELSLLLSPCSLCLNNRPHCLLLLSTPRGRVWGNRYVWGGVRVAGVHIQGSLENPNYHFLPGIESGCHENLLKSSLFLKETWIKQSCLNGFLIFSPLPFFAVNMYTLISVASYRCHHH